MKKETEIKMKAKKYDLLWVFLIALIVHKAQIKDGKVCPIIE